MPIGPLGFAGAGMTMPQAGGGSVLEKVLGMLGSKGGQTLVNAAGAGLSAYGQHKSAEADRAMNAEQFAANMAQRQFEGDREAQARAAVSSATLNPIGTTQDYAAKQAMAKAILGGLRNTSYSPADAGVAAAKGTHTGGFRLPEGGFDPGMLERLFGDNATASSIAQHHKQLGAINPRGPKQDLVPYLGTSADGTESPFVSDVNSFQRDELTRQDEESKRQRELIMRAIDNDIRGSKQGGGSKVGGALGSAASGASLGSMFGPWGAAIGGIGGFLGGLF